MSSLRRLYGSLAFCSSAWHEHTDSTTFQKTVRCQINCLLLYFYTLTGSFSSWDVNIGLFCVCVCVDTHMCVCLFLSAVVVAKGNDTPVTLTCHTKFSGPVTWRIDGDENNDFNDRLQQDGHTLRITNVEYPMLGEYSCWGGGQMLWSTYLLLKNEEEEEFGELKDHFSLLLM